MLVPKRIFAISKAAAREQGRYAINGVALQRTPDGRPLALATDGRRLLVATWREEKAADLPEGVMQGQDIQHTPDAEAHGLTQGVIVPLTAWAEAERSIPRKAPRPILKHAAFGVEGRMVKIGASDLEIAKRNDALAVAGIFPKWRSVLPRYDEDETVCVSVNPKYLAELAQTVADIAGDQDDGSVTLVIKDGKRPLLVVKETPEGAAIGVLMPCGDEKDDHCVQFCRYKRILNKLTSGEIAAALATTPKPEAQPEEINSNEAEAMETRSAGFGAESDLEEDMVEAPDQPADEPEHAQDAEGERILAEKLAEVEALKIRCAKLEHKLDLRRDRLARIQGGRP